MHVCKLCSDREYKSRLKLCLWMWNSRLFSALCLVVRYIGSTCRFIATLAIHSLWTVHFKLVIIFQGQFNLHPLTDDAVVATVTTDASLCTDVIYGRGTGNWTVRRCDVCMESVCKIVRNLMLDVLLVLSTHFASSLVRYEHEAFCCLPFWMCTRRPGAYERTQAS